jgi:hypothetical protein
VLGLGRHVLGGIFAPGKREGGREGGRVRTMLWLLAAYISTEGERETTHV